MRIVECNVARRSVYEPILCRLQSVVELPPVQRQFRFVRLDGQPFGHRPGQFMQVSAFGVGEAPISVASSPTRPRYLDLGIRTVGAVTRALHELSIGDDVGVRGPFGTGFDIGAMHGRDVVLIAGGCGLAGMRSLAQYCEDRREEFANVTFLFGAKTPQDLFYRDDLFRWARSESIECLCTVDRVPDGQVWQGHVGLITKLISTQTIDSTKTVAAIVGPPMMYRPVIAGLHAKGIQDENIQLSLERHMKCGIGKCGHCMIEHLYCCLDGPVFHLSDIINLPGIIDIRGVL